MKKAPLEVTLFDIILNVHGKKASAGSRAIKSTTSINKGTTSSTIEQSSATNTYEKHRVINPLKSSIKHIDLTSQDTSNDNTKKVIQSLTSNSKKIPTKKKKKKFSKMKKRILLARLRHHLDSKNITFPTIAATVNTDANTDGSISGSLDLLISNDSLLKNNKCVLCLINFADETDMEDEAEFEEVFDNVNTLSSPFGIIKYISSITESTNELIQQYLDNLVIAVVFDDDKSAGHACTALEGIVIGGQHVQTMLCREDEVILARSSSSKVYDDIPMVDTFTDASQITSYTFDRNVMYEKKIGRHEFVAVLKICNMVLPEDIIDEDEIAEVLENIQAICEDFGEITSVWLEDNGLSRKSNIGIHLSSQPIVHIKYESILTSLRVAKCLNNLCISGQVITTKLLIPIDNFSQSSQEQILSTVEPSIIVPFDGLYILKYSEGNNITEKNIDIEIDISNIIFHSHNNLLNIISLKDSSYATINRSVSLLRDGKPYGFGFVSSSISECLDILNNIQILSISKILYEIILLQEVQCDLNLLKFCDTSPIVTVNLNVDYNFISFGNLNDLSRVIICVEGYINQEDIDLPADELKEMKRDLLNLPGLPHEAHKPTYIRICQNRKMNVTGDEIVSPVVGCVGFQDVKSAVEAMLQLDSTIVGGNVLEIYTVYSDKLYTDEISQEQFSIPRLKVTNESENIVTSKVRNDEMMTTSHEQNLSTEPLQDLKYANAIGVSHLPKHIGPSHDNIPVGNDEVNQLVFSMLDALATFQKRLKERDPIKAKAKLRFVVGMKQVINGTKAGKVKLILLAPDTEINEEVDTKLTSLVTIASTKEVPVLYSLNRRRLAKACQLSMRQSVVGVYDPDGVYDSFKKIIQYITSQSQEKA